MSDIKNKEGRTSKQWRELWRRANSTEENSRYWNKERFELHFGVDPEPEEDVSNTLAKAEVPEAVIVAEIVHSGDKMILPESCSLKQALNLIERRMAYEQETVSLSQTFDVFPWDGAHAFAEVLTAKYGWAPAEATPGFWGDTPPKLISIDIDFDRVTKVPWGQFSLPNVEGMLATGVDMKDGRYVFQLAGTVKRAYEAEVSGLFNDLRTYLKTGSIYRGKAIRIRFNDDEGAKLKMPEPKFMNTNDVDESQLVYSREVHNAIDTNLFTPIKRVRELRANGIPVKRGVLLGGVFGTGKTLAAKVASKYAVQTGVTFIYVTRADELADAINFARQYQDPACVVFCEDIDRVMDGERDMQMDDILNIIDGIDTKNANIITVLTTNNMQGINAAMLRPGRLDSVIDVKAPDAEAVQRLLRVYGGDAIDPAADLSRVGMLLDGAIPAVIAEVVKRAKLHQLRLNPAGTLVSMISAEALEDSAESMAMQMDLLYTNGRPDAAKPELEQALTTLVDTAVRAAFEKAGLDNVGTDLAAIADCVK